MLNLNLINEMKPSVTYNDSKFFADGIELDLKGKPHLQKLFRLLVEDKNHRLFKNDLVKSIYFPDVEVSSRYERHAHTNLIKLMSRARGMLAQVYPQWDWLPFDYESGCWHLCRLPMFTSPEENSEQNL